MKERELKLRVAKIQSRIMAYVLGILGGLLMFIATAWLLIKGGENVGEHLGLLSNFFPGYSVTWFGSLFGTIYGFMFGAFIGWFIGFTYYKLVQWRSPNS